MHRPYFNELPIRLEVVALVLSADPFAEPELPRQREV